MLKDSQAGAGQWRSMEHATEGACFGLDRDKAAACKLAPRGNEILFPSSHVAFIFVFWPFFTCTLYIWKQKCELCSVKIAWFLFSTSGDDETMSRKDRVWRYWRCGGERRQAWAARVPEYFYFQLKVICKQAKSPNSRWFMPYIDQNEAVICEVWHLHMQFVHFVS